MAETKARHIANLVEDDGDVKSAHLDNITVTPTAVSDQANTSTGYLDLPSGTSAQRPGTATSGNVRFNSTTGSLEFYDGTNWISTNLIPNINSITGTIYATASSTLTLSLTNATDTIDVKYYEGSTLLATESNVTVSSGSATSTVPSEVYGQTAGDTISIQIVNEDGTPSSNSINKTVATPPSGGTKTTSGNYHIHSFTTTGSSNFVNPIANLSIEYLVIAGGGAGGSAGAGGGAGGYRTNVSGQTSGANSSTEPALTLPAATYTITVGAGGAISGGNTGGQGNPSSISHSGITDITTVGGGGGGNFNSNPLSPTDGGSAGGQAATNGSAATPTANQGMAGASGTGGGGDTSGGGGGGAGEAGQAGTATTAGRGGNGLSNNITGTAVTRAGGGAGGGDARTTSGGVDGNSGGTGGGGQSYKTANGGVGQAGTDGTGSGGAGGTISSGGDHTVNGGDGGDGIVIIRYQLP